MKFKLILFLSLFLTVVSIGAILGGSQQKTQNLSPHNLNITARLWYACGVEVSLFLIYFR